jgi:hypothetical protein
MLKMCLHGGKNKNYARMNCMSQHHKAVMLKPMISHIDEAKFVQGMQIALDKHAVLIDISVGSVDAILHEDMTADERWILLLNPENKHQSAQWIHTDSTPSKKFYISSTEKMMGC